MRKDAEPTRPRHGLKEPSRWLRRFAGLVEAGGAVLDVACGAGRHSRLFLALGHPVTALDIDVSGLADIAQAPGLTVIEADLEEGGPWPLGEERFAAVVVTRYLWRPLLPTLVAAVAPGGVLIYETFARGNERFAKPKCPDYLLEPDELLDAVRGALTVVAYEHGEVARPRSGVVQRICAVRDAGGHITARLG